jgi:hypothetical protein
MRIATYAVLVALVSAPDLVQQRKYSSFQFDVGTAEYFGETYVERPSPRASWVFFRGEPLTLRLSIGSTNGEDELRIPSPQASDFISVTATRDGTPVDLQLTFSDVNWIGLDERAHALASPERIRLNPGEQLQWTARLTSALSPGLYRLHFDIRANDELSRPVAPIVTNFAFDLKPSTPAYRPEILLPAAARHAFSQDSSELALAEAAVTELLRIHPTSVLAFLIRERIARARGLRDQARVETRKALDLINADQDLLLRQFKSPEEIANIKKELSWLSRQH